MYSVLGSRRKAPRYIHPSQDQSGGERRKRCLHILFPLFFILVFLALSSIFLKDLSSRIAISDARDIVTERVNQVISDLMREHDYSPDYFIQIEKNERGEVSAISSDMGHINALSSEILERVIGSTENRTLTVFIPAGNLSGVSLMMGRGPSIPVQIIMLTSSHVAFSNQVLTAGINQTKHQISLQIYVDIDVLVPWGAENSQVTTEVLIADTVVVGQVPESYFAMQ